MKPYTKNQARMPLLEKLEAHATMNPFSFHVPGHKNGFLFHHDARSRFNSILEIDQTELEGLDDLHQPTGVIKEAENLLTALYGSEESHFLVGGSTVGNLVAMFATVKKGERVIVQRNSHQSVFHALELREAIPVFISADEDADSELALGVSITQLKKAFQSYPDAKAVFLTSPSYEGFVQNLGEHVALAHKHGAFVCIDEAHGAHFLQKTGVWSQTAQNVKADLVVQSAHKTLPSMTMGAWLHINGEKVSTSLIRKYLRMFQSSSPSYPIMASLDAARSFIGIKTVEEWSRIEKKAEEVYQRMEKTSLKKFLVPRHLGRYRQDPLKILLHHSKKGVTRKWQEELEKCYLYSEMVTPVHLLMTLPLTSETYLWEAMWTELDTIFEPDDFSELTGKRNKSTLNKKEMDLELSFLTYGYEEMAHKETRRVSWRELLGEVAAQTLTPYPPGVPLLLAGERVSEKQVAELARHVAGHSSFQEGKNWISEGVLVYLG